jgi:hypothetical protein
VVYSKAPQFQPATGARLQNAKRMLPCFVARR